MYVCMGTCNLDYSGKCKPQLPYHCKSMLEKSCLPRMVQPRLTGSSMHLHFMQTYQNRSPPQSASVLHGFPLWVEISWKTFNERKQEYDGFQQQLKNQLRLFNSLKFLTSEYHLRGSILLLSNPPECC